MSNGNYQAAFFTVPSRILDLPGLTLAFLKFYETIFQFWHHRKPCYLSNPMIMERIGVTSSSTIKDAFDFFIMHGEMKKQIIDGKRYITQPDLKIEMSEKDENQSIKNGGAKTSTPIGRAIPPYRQSDTPPIGRAIHNNKNINNKNINIKTYCASNDALIGFEEFWELYNLKKNKKKAIKAWKKITPSLHATIMKDIRERGAKDHDWLRGAKPHPCTYLNGARWEDEIIESIKKPIESTKKETGIERGIRLYNEMRG